MNNTQRALLQVLEAVGAGPSRVVYVVVPITSGRRELELMRKLGYRGPSLKPSHPELWRQEVLEPNKADAETFVSQIRRRVSSLLVVDPSRLEIPRWTQDDYGSFWNTVIQRFAQQLVVAPDWAFSRGCRLEVALATRLGIPIRNDQCEILTRRDILEADRLARLVLNNEGWSDQEIETYLPSLVHETDGHE